MVCRNSTLTQQQLKNLLQYDPNTGAFVWLVDVPSRVKAGDHAGYLSGGYQIIKIAQAKIVAHRLAWLYVHGYWPEKEIDHINGDRSDNRIVNLREVTHAENGQNLRKARSHNLTGLLGVSPKRNRWTAEVCVGGVRHRLGVYDTPEAAHAAYLAKKRELHPFNTL